MCIHFTPTRNKAWVKQRLGVDLPTGNFPEETYPGYAAPLVLKSHQTGRMACGLAKFGLIPGWAKDEKKARRWRIALASQEPFGIASIYEAWLCADTPNAAAMMN